MTQELREQALEWLEQRGLKANTTIMAEFTSSILKDRFIEICADAHPQAGWDSLFALDESGQVWQYDFNERAWLPLSRKRGAGKSA